LGQLVFKVSAFTLNVPMYACRWLHHGLAALAITCW